MKKTSCIITLIGTETFKILESLTFPEKPERYNSEDLFKMLTSHFEPKRLKIAEQYRFWRNTQGPFRALLTTFPPYTKRLKLVNFSWRVSTRCFVHDSVTHELLFEKDLTLDKAISIVQNMEAAGKEANEITVPVPNPVNFVKTPSRRPTQKTLPPGPCPSYGAKDHWQSACPHRNTVCSCCKRSGHLARVCRDRQKQQSGKTKQFHPPNRQTNVINMLEESEHCTDVLTVLDIYF